MGDIVTGCHLRGMDHLARESFALDLSGKVEQTPAGPILHGALICGEESKWGYGYPENVWTPPTIAAYEGLPSFSGHNKTGEQPDPDKKIGWWTNPRKRANGQLEGDYHVNPKHPLCDSVVWAAEHNPGFYSFSHQAYVQYGTVNGRKVVTSITRPVSCDLVVAGATTGGIFEHAPFGVQPVTTLKDYLKVLAPKLDYSQLLKIKTAETLVKEGFDDAPMGASAPDPAAPATTADGGMDESFLAMCTKQCADVIADKGNPAKLKSCLGKLKKLLMTHSELSEESVDAAEDEEEESAEPKPAKEGAPGAAGANTSAPVVATVDAAELLTELAAEGWTPSPSQLIAVKGITDKPTRIIFIREQKGLNAATAPKSKGRDQKVAEGAPGDPPSGVEAERLKARERARENQGIPLVAATK